MKFLKNSKHICCNHPPTVLEKSHGDAIWTWGFIPLKILHHLSNFLLLKSNFLLLKRRLKHATFILPNASKIKSINLWILSRCFLVQVIVNWHNLIPHLLIFFLYHSTYFQHPQMVIFPVRISQLLKIFSIIIPLFRWSSSWLMSPRYLF